MTAPRRPLSPIYDAILIFRGGSPPTEGRPVAEVGGFWRVPEYGLAYLLAARYVVEGGQSDERQNEVALPAVYLQRHPLEVTLKGLIRMARGIKDEAAWLAAQKAGAKGPPPAEREVPFTHHLPTLIRLLGEALSEIDYGDVPAELVSAANQIREVERKDETRGRYAKGRDGETSFPDRIVVPVGQLQDDLEKAFEKHLHLDINFQTHNLVTNLAEEQLALEQAFQRLEGG